MDVLRGSRARSVRHHRAVVVLVGAGLLAGMSAWVPGAVAVGRTTRADTDLPKGAIRLPDGRYVQPAGQSFDLGDFSLGLAVSPSGRCAASTGEGWGNGQPVPAVAGVNEAGTQPDEGITSVDLTTGHTSFATEVSTTGQHFMGIGVAYSAGRLTPLRQRRRHRRRLPVRRRRRLLADLRGHRGPSRRGSSAPDVRPHRRHRRLRPQVGRRPGRLGARHHRTRSSPQRRAGRCGRQPHERRSRGDVRDADGRPHSTSVLNFIAGNDTAPPTCTPWAAGTHPVTGRTRSYMTAEGTKQLLTADAEGDGAGGWTAGPVAAVGDHPTGLASSAFGRGAGSRRPARR
jgi:hypothetical protein